MDIRSYRRRPWVVCDKHLLFGVDDRRKYDHMWRCELLMSLLFWWKQLYLFLLYHSFLARVDLILVQMNRTITFLFLHFNQVSIFQFLPWVLVDDGMGKVGRHVSIEHAFWVDSFGWQRIAEISCVKLSTFCGVLMMTELMKWAALVLRFYLNLRGGSNVSFGSACESVLSLSCVMHGMVGPVGGNDCTPSEVHCSLSCCAPLEVHNGAVDWAPSETACHGSCSCRTGCSRRTASSFSGKTSYGWFLSAHDRAWVASRIRSAGVTLGTVITRWSNLTVSVTLCVLVWLEKSIANVSLKGRQNLHYWSDVPVYFLLTACRARGIWYLVGPSALTGNGSHRTGQRGPIVIYFGGMGAWGSG